MVHLTFLGDAIMLPKPIIPISTTPAAGSGDGTGTKLIAGECPCSCCNVCLHSGEAKAIRHITELQIALGVSRE
jgi:hypothetical protein